MNKINKIALLLLSIGTMSNAQATNIGISMTSFDNPFLNILINGMKSADQSNDDITLQFEDANSDIGRQLNQVQSFIASGVDAIIVNAVDGDSTMAITQMTNEAGIPLVYVNHPPIDIHQLPDTASFVGSNELDSGTLQTEEVCRLLNGKGNALVIIGPLENHAALTRTKDVEKVLSRPECSGIKILDKQVANWSRTQAYDLMTNWITSGIEFNSVIANNDEMAIGAIQAIEASSLNIDNIVVAGIDATADGLAAMRSGELSVTVFQNATKQGQVAVQTAYKMVHGDPVDRNLWVPFELVTKQNLSQYSSK
ncbi:monosaccharide ABC transporter substrate-binding protein (CUT2 family) [Marinomonas alcarazii]|uniref:Monosaccharide ABC transporter substrate-binding protein (CUT2 family) n=1 Tax=Marinomonas alcarazii TaxID=491949 RepID=A0A318V5J0_9GAMM|nr:sugar ABC transporter substrate-binding protein [Marinomonas alcarazii]PYF84106.1 monosaccharide ABC transporter substrate-binding protein (CUT2 family) [Marinomonas alcarazii]